jgi:phosphoribosylformylglycinamidine synthase
MAFGNMTGVEAYAPVLSLTDEHNYQGSVLAELKGEAPDGSLIIAARTLENPVFRIAGESANNDEDSPAAEVPLEVLRRAYEYPLARVYPQTSTGNTAAEPDSGEELPSFVGMAASQKTKSKPGNVSKAAPLVLIPVFPGTINERDIERAFRKAGAETRQIVFRNQNKDEIKDSFRQLETAIGEAQIIALSGGFGAGAEPDGSGKLIANVLESPAIRDALLQFLEKQGGLILGINTGFQALLRTGLLPHGKYGESNIITAQNKLGRHVSRMARTKVMSDNSPWLKLEEPGAINVIPVSCGEGRIVIERAEAEKLFNAGQVPFCYADDTGCPAAGEPDNPGGSDFAIESICSPDGRILGKMGHPERAGEHVHINIPGNKILRIFEAGVSWFR